MMENLRRGSQRVVVMVEVENEEYNEQSEERGRHRDGESTKTSLAPRAARQDMHATVSSVTVTLRPQINFSLDSYTAGTDQCWLSRLACLVDAQVRCE